MANAVDPNSIVGGIKNGKTGFDLLHEVAEKLWQGPVKYALESYQDGSGTRELKQKLGEWACEAQDDKGRWLQPILTRDAFERHLLKEGGRFRPSRKCTASFGWAKLLYALNIRPKGGSEQGILSWRTAPQVEPSPDRTGNISLVIHGEVLCHIINLYQTYTGTNSAKVSAFQLTFGELKLSDTVSHSYTFESLGDYELALERQPFRYSMASGPKEDYFRFELQGVDNTISSYFQALGQGISKNSLRLDETNKTLPERVQLLLVAMEKIMQRDWNNPYIVTPSWIDHASRIKRRATTNGGKDDLLMCHIQAFIGQNTDIVRSLKRPLRNEDDWERLLESTIKALFMFDKDQYEFIWDLKLELSSRENPQFVAIVKKHLLESLEGLSKTDKGRVWERTMAETSAELVPAQDLLKVLEIPHKILSQPVMVLQHIPDKWNFLDEISG